MVFAFIPPIFRCVRFCSTFPLNAFYWQHQHELRITNVTQYYKYDEQAKKKEWITYRQVSGFETHHYRIASRRWSFLSILLSSFWRVAVVNFTFMRIYLFITTCFMFITMFRFLGDWNGRVSFYTCRNTLSSDFAFFVTTVAVLLSRNVDIDTE